MTKRDGQLQAYGEYQAAVQEAEKKKPEGSWYKLPSEDCSGEGRLIYDPAMDSLEMSIPGCSAIIPGKYLRGMQVALNSFMGEGK